LCSTFKGSCRRLRGCENVIKIPLGYAVSPFKKGEQKIKNVLLYERRGTACGGGFLSMISKNPQSFGRPLSANGHSLYLRFSPSLSGHVIA